MAHIFVDGEQPDVQSTFPVEPVSADSAAPIKKDAAPALTILRTRIREGRVVASPRARKIAAVHTVDLSTIIGSGPYGRIVAADVEAAISSFATNKEANLPKETTDGNARRRQLIANQMVESITTIPSFSVSVEVDARHLVTLHENLRERIEEAAGTKLTYTDLLLKALAVGLVRTPQMNAVWENGSPRRLGHVAIAMAVATDRGVVAPVLQDVDRLPLDRLVQSRLRMTQKARKSKLILIDLEGASGTLSNLGMYRVDRCEGIITPGRKLILAVGQLKKRPWIIENALTVTPTLILNLSVDHRVVDGSIAAQFLGQVAEAIESPYQLLWSVDMAQTGSKR